MECKYVSSYCSWIVSSSEVNHKIVESEPSLQRLWIFYFQLNLYEKISPTFTTQVSNTKTTLRTPNNHKCRAILIEMMTSWVWIYNIFRFRHTAKIPYGENSVRRKFHTTKIPYVEYSVQQKFRTTKSPYGEKSYCENSYGKNSYGEKSIWRKFRTLNNPYSENFVRRKVHTANSPTAKTPTAKIHTAKIPATDWHEMGVTPRALLCN